MPSTAGLVASAFTPSAADDGWVRIGASVRTIVQASQITNCDSVREQDAIVYDPSDPNLGSFPERLHKFYFTAIISGNPRVYVCFSADGLTWSSPTRCVMGSSDHQSEDPSVTTLIDRPGEVYRDGSTKMYLYCENSNTGTSSTVYVYESTNGIDFTEMTSNPAIAKGTTGQWDATLTGSPVARHDGTNFVIGYEGIAADTYEGFGLAVGATANSITKAAANPVWAALNEPVADKSIVVDSFEKVGSAFYFWGHDGIGSDNTTVFRGKTTNPTPSTWVSGDITGMKGVLGPVRNDVTLDASARGLIQVVSAPVDDQSMQVYRLDLRAESLPPTLPTHWWDFNDADFYTLTSSRYSTITDKMGGKKLTAPSSPTNEPTQATRNSRSVADFDGTDFMIGSNAAKWAWMNDGTNYLLVMSAQAGKVANPGVDYGLISTGSAVAATGRMFVRFDDNGGRDNVIIAAVTGALLDVATLVSGNGSFTANAWHMLSAYFDPDNATTAARAEITVDGAENAATNSATGTAQAAAHSFLRLGAEGSSNSNQLVGFIGEVMLFRLGSGTISDADRNAIIDWVGARASVTT